MSKDSNDKMTRLIIIGKVFENNAKLFDLITRQIHLLEKYEKHFDGLLDVEKSIISLEEMLRDVGLTGERFDDEWDDEMGRKS
tara:strand:- start:200 stop:448 length:249 start_codon:yes stop_codon:yes gene_type:complete